jgi:hypothetical protein
MIQRELNPFTKGIRLIKKEITTEELQLFLSGIKSRLDCGQYATIGHSFANTIIIVSVGGGKIETYCHNCGY